MIGRRDLLKVGAMAVAPTSARIPLGFDNFSVRALKLKAPALIALAAELQVDSLFISDLDAFESLETPHLRELRQRAADAGVRLHLGTWSVCPTSVTFKKDWGTAEQHLALAIRVAKDLGSPVARVILGRAEDRATPGGIEARIRDMVKVLRAQRSRARDAGVTVAVENHAGDLLSHELVTLVQQAGGSPTIGVNIDPGNAVWGMEDPVAHLEALAPYVATTSVRDSMIWESERGATVQWTAMGEGVVDWKAWTALFAARCPGVPVHIETISGFNREIPYLDPKHWPNYPGAKAAALARWVQLAKRGRPKPPWQAPAGVDKARAEGEHQRGELVRSLAYCRDVLGLGTRRPVI